MSSPLLHRIMKEDDERNRLRRERNRELEETQEQSRAEETGKIQAREGEKERKDPYGIYAMADRIKKGKKGI